MVTRCVRALAILLLALCTTGPLALVAATAASAESGTTLTCQLTAAEDGSRAVTFAVADLPRGARVVLARRDGPKGAFRVVDTSTEAQGILRDLSPTNVRSLYRVEVLELRGRIVAQQVLQANR